MMDVVTLVREVCGGMQGACAEGGFVRNGQFTELESMSKLSLTLMKDASELSEHARRPTPIQREMVGEYTRLISSSRKSQVAKQRVFVQHLSLQSPLTDSSGGQMRVREFTIPTPSRRQLDLGSVPAS